MNNKEYANIIVNELTQTLSSIKSEEAEKFAKEFFTKRCENRPANYANGRDVRNFFEKVS